MAETVQDIFPEKESKQDLVNNVCNCYKAPHIQFQHTIKTTIENFSKCLLLHIYYLVREMNCWEA